MSPVKRSIVWACSLLVEILSAKTPKNTAACTHNISCLSINNHVSPRKQKVRWVRARVEQKMAAVLAYGSGFFFFFSSYLHLSRACASSKLFVRKRSRAAMQSSRASDRSEREHLQDQNKQRLCEKRKRVMKICFQTINELNCGDLSSTDLLIYQ